MIERIYEFHSATCLFQIYQCEFVCKQEFLFAAITKVP
jgi:hypothetical protein